MILKRLKDLSKEINTSDITITEGSNESMEEKSGIEEPVEEVIKELIEVFGIVQLPETIKTEFEYFHQQDQH